MKLKPTQILLAVLFIVAATLQAYAAYKGKEWLHFEGYILMGMFIHFIALAGVLSYDGNKEP
jgi:hypothetical protein